MADTDREIAVETFIDAAMDCRDQGVLWQAIQALAAALAGAAEPGDDTREATRLDRLEARVNELEAAVDLLHRESRIRSGREDREADADQVVQPPSGPTIAEPSP